LEEKENHLKVRSYLEDDTPFELFVSSHDLIRIPKVDNPKIHPNRGWLNVEYSGEANGRASVTLPTPTLNLGSRVTVKTNRLKKPEAPDQAPDARHVYKIVALTIDEPGSTQESEFNLQPDEPCCGGGCGESENSE